MRKAGRLAIIPSIIVLLAGIAGQLGSTFGSSYIAQKLGVTVTPERLDQLLQTVAMAERNTGVPVTDYLRELGVHVDPVLYRVFATVVYSRKILLIAGGALVIANIVVLVIDKTRRKSEKL